MELCGVGQHGGEFDWRLIEYVMPIELQSWYRGRSLVLLTVPVLAAAWATWVIVSAQGRPASEAATAAASN